MYMYNCIYTVMYIFQVLLVLRATEQEINQRSKAAESGWSALTVADLQTTSEGTCTCTYTFTHTCTYTVHVHAQCTHACMCIYTFLYVFARTSGFFLSFLCYI